MTAHRVRLAQPYLPTSSVWRVRCSCGFVSSCHKHEITAIAVGHFHATYAADELEEADQAQ